MSININQSTFIAGNSSVMINRDEFEKFLDEVACGLPPTHPASMAVLAMTNLMSKDAVI